MKKTMITMKKSLMLPILPLLLASQTWAGATVNSSLVCRVYLKNPRPAPSYDPNTGALIPSTQSKYSYEDLQLNTSQVDFSDPTTLVLENQLSFDPNQPNLQTVVSISFPSAAEAKLAKAKFETGGMQLFTSMPSVTDDDLSVAGSPCDWNDEYGHGPMTVKSSDLRVLNDGRKNGGDPTPLDSFLGAPDARFASIIEDLSNNVNAWYVLHAAQLGNQDPKIVSELSKDVQTFPSGVASTAGSISVLDAPSYPQHSAE